MRLYGQATLLLAVAAFLFTAGVADAQKKYDVGATDTEIKIGNTSPYSGPASAYGALGKTQDAFFRKINAEGGINGRKIVFLSYDDAYSSPKTVEHTRKLVEGDEVLLVSGSVGTPSNSAIQKYMNVKKVPQLFVGSGAAKWNDPKNFPWTMGLTPSYYSEGHVYASYLLRERPDAKVAVFFQNDDYGKDYVKGFKDGLGNRAVSMIVIEDGYEVSEPTIDSHIVKLKSSGANVLLNVSSAKFAAQSIKKMAEIDWKPLHLLNSVSISIAGVIKPAGLENAQGIISASFYKDLSDKRWENDKGVKEMSAFLEKYFPEADRKDTNLVVGYILANALVQTLKQCGDELTRENIMKQAANLKDFEIGLLLPGIKVNTSPTDFAPIKQWQLMRFKGETWDLFGDLIVGG